MGLGLILPPSVEERRRVLRCTVPGCGRCFPLEQVTKFERHVKGCAERNSDRIDAKVAQLEGSYLTSPADKELYEHYRKGGT